MDRYLIRRHEQDHGLCIIRLISIKQEQSIHLKKTILSNYFCIYIYIHHKPQDEKLSK